MPSAVSPNVERLLSRLDGVRETGHNKWKARCPNHPDKTPSLAIRETPEGRVLIHDFGGCGAADVLDAIGLRFSDLQTFTAHNLGSVRPDPKSVAGWLRLLISHGRVLLRKPLNDEQYAKTLGAVRQIKDDVTDATYRNCLIVSLAATARARSETLDERNLGVLKSAIDGLSTR